MSTTESIPAELASALASDPEAQALFKALPASHKSEYTKWVDDVKKASTRLARAQAALDMLKDKAAEKK